MKIVFISHPVSANGINADWEIKRNKDSIITIVRAINLKLAGIIPFVPYYSDVEALDDLEPAERAKGMANGVEVLVKCIEGKVIDEMWLFGPVISMGMREEMAIAKQHGLLIRDFTCAFTAGRYEFEFKDGKNYINGIEA